jgi:hypothetical protein
MQMKKRRIRRFLLWLLPVRRVKIPAEPVTGPWRTGSTVTVPGALGDWDDLAYPVTRRGNRDS